MQSSKVANPLPKPPKIVVFTGPGLSRASGFAPFDSMPRSVRLEDVVTRDGFVRDPELVYDFYNRRRRELHAVSPNLAHQALAALDLMRPGDVLTITRNVDDLHERAGNQAVIHTHGELLKARCAICTKVSDWFDDLNQTDHCPVCGNGGHLRPHIVWVGEEPLGIGSSYVALATCETFVSIGNAGGGEPGRGFLAEAKRAGARTLEFAHELTSLSPEFGERFHGPLMETVPAWVKRTLATG
ncbi:MAG TPA: Sir2 family NAD-dependent protein deacetylase [Stellaceae bacterium]|nr:Sir2 family NAD-dependent protein deacetylase [Stellaceae bacterium]